MNDLRRLHGRQILAQLDDGTTLAGLVALAGKTTLTLEGATALAGNREQPIDGEVVVMIDRIVWMQAP